MKILIIGAGKIGRAIEYLLKRSDQKIEVKIFDTDPAKITEKFDIEEYIPKADIIFHCVNSWVVDKNLDQYSKLVKPKTVNIFISKGIDPENDKNVYEIATNYLDQAQIALMFGPMLAQEIIDGQGGCATIATPEQKNYQTIKNIFKNTGLSLEYSDDMAGVCLMGTLKNVYSIVVGMLVQSDSGYNKTGAILDKIIAEMMQLAGDMGAEDTTIMGYAGVSDLLATGLSPDSTNHTAGVNLLDKGEVLDRAEGVSSYKSLIYKIENQLLKLDRYPIFNMLGRILDSPDKSREYFANIIEI